MDRNEYRKQARTVLQKKALARRQRDEIVRQYGVIVASKHRSQQPVIPKESIPVAKAQPQQSTPQKPQPRQMPQTAKKGCQTCRRNHH